MDVVDVTIFSIRVSIKYFLPLSFSFKLKYFQLLQYVDDENKVHEYEELTDITEDLTATLRLGRKTIHNPVIGHQYAFYNFDEQEGIYYRCEVLNSEDDCVKIKLIDKGTIISTLPSRLYRLPKEFDCTVRPRASKLFGASLKFCKITYFFGGCIVLFYFYLERMYFF